ncbi:hypothetical protein Tco_0256203 [Tanacetum coccineum]
MDEKPNEPGAPLMWRGDKGGGSVGGCDEMVDSPENMEAPEINGVSVVAMTYVVWASEGGHERKTPVTQNASTGPSTQTRGNTSANVFHDTLSPKDSTNNAETVVDMEQSNSETATEILNVEEERGEEVSYMLALEERSVKLDEGQARSDPGKTPESQPLPERELIEEDQAGSNPEQSYVAQARHYPEPIHEDFIAIVYPKVHY